MSWRGMRMGRIQGTGLGCSMGMGSWTRCEGGKSLVFIKCTSKGLVSRKIVAIRVLSITFFPEIT
eukprot:1687149-Ditylum_brightwellii.AAC.1